MQQIDVDDEIRSSFHIFWDNFPFPVMLNRKDRTIIECNKAAILTGIIPGTRCIDFGGKEFHKECLADQALREQSTKRLVAYIDPMEAVLDSYWLPLDGYPNYYIHFSIDINEYAADRFFPNKPEKE